MSMTQQMLKNMFEYIDGELFWKKRSAQKISIGDKAGSLSCCNYVRIRVENKYYRRHRLVWMMFNGDLPDLLDHIDGDPTNDRIENLRPASYSQNSYNQKTRANNSSGIKGVCWNKNANMWKARLNSKGKEYHLGYFKTKEEAADVIKNMRELLHGEFARHS